MEAAPPIPPTAALEDNRLLAQLPPKERRMLRSCMELVPTRAREEINSPGSRLRHFYFPVKGAISLMSVEASGRTVEGAIIGPEGCTCSYVLEGIKKSPCRALVQIGGMAFRLNVSTFHVLASKIPLFGRIVQRFNAVVFRHVVISLGCSQFHSVEQRVGRWLLAHRYRTGSNRLPFTHDFLAEQLGVQRVTVTNVLAAYGEQGIVRYRYGKVELLNLRALNKIACNCFSLAKRAIDDYLTDIKTFGT
jgi:CRP-like cAMP-binding protein